MTDTKPMLKAISDSLAEDPPRLPSKYFYDGRGSELFEEITRQPEYYLTRTELTLMRDHAESIAEHVGPGASIIEYGSGAGRKPRLLLELLDSVSKYLPVEINAEFLAKSSAALAQEFPGVEVTPINADYTRPFNLPKDLGDNPLVYFPGSTIGNFTRREAAGFLRQMVEHLLPNGGLLIGVDLVKDPEVLHRAYNDAAGVTAAFNRNLLVRLNREIGTNFEVDRFYHYAPYNPLEKRIEMHLVSAASQDVTVGSRTFHFAEGQSILTEFSHKHSPESFDQLAIGAGFQRQALWTDPDRYFGLFYYTLT